MFQAGVNSARIEAPQPLGLAVDRGLAGFVAMSESIVLAVRPGARVVVVQQPAPVAHERAVKSEKVEILVQARTATAEQATWLPGDSEGSG